MEQLLRTTANFCSEVIFHNIDFKVPTCQVVYFTFRSIFDQVISVGVQLVKRSILKHFPYEKLQNTPQHSCTPTEFT